MTSEREYTRAIPTIRIGNLLLTKIVLVCLIYSLNLIAWHQGKPVSFARADEERHLIEKITFQDSQGNTNEELAFRAPIRGYPNEVLKLYCANIKLRLYWGVFRETTKSALRTGVQLRQLARFSRHLYKEIRKVDQPMDEVSQMLSTIDEWFGVKSSEEEQNELDRIIKHGYDPTVSTKPQSTIKRTMTKLKAAIKRNTPTVLVGAYTRWATMWWLMMSCLFAKYYLWDPALDEFLKLQRSMIMYPEFQLLKLQDIDCLPTKFFERLIDTCKVLNPLMNIDFGQLSLDNMWRFKGDDVKN